MKYGIEQRLVRQLYDDFALGGESLLQVVKAQQVVQLQKKVDEEEGTFTAVVSKRTDCQYLTYVGGEKGIERVDTIECGPDGPWEMLVVRTTWVTR